MNPEWRIERIEWKDVNIKYNIAVGAYSTVSCFKTEYANIKLTKLLYINTDLTQQ